MGTLNHQPDISPIKNHPFLGLRWQNDHDTMTGASRCSEHPRKSQMLPSGKHTKSYGKCPSRNSGYLPSYKRWWIFPVRYVNVYQMVWLLSENMVPQNSVSHHHFAIEIAILVVYHIPHFQTHPFKLHPDVPRSTAVPFLDDVCTVTALNP